MRRNLAILLCIVLAGCAGLPGSLKGKEDRNVAADEKIASDTANQLARLYPPARTQFNLVLTEPHGFGSMLAAQLREKGYAVSESTPTTASPFPFDSFGSVFKQERDSGTKQEAVSFDTRPGIELRYTLNHPRHESLLRIMVKVGDRYLARAYLADGASMAAAGAWTFREE